uniref:C-type lectin domain-containing protein n=1 Tax=Syphacia muris TaxID=451379 RepID=A0A0N5AVH0_9BILA
LLNLKENQRSRSIPLKNLPYSSKLSRSYRRRLQDRYHSLDPEVYLPPPYVRPRNLRTGISVAEGEEKCKSEGAELTSICSAEENDFIRDLLIAKNSGSAWFGLRLIPEIVETDNWFYEFTDRQVCEYRNWMFGKPDNHLSRKGEMCAIISPDGDWDSYDCGDTKYIRAYVCKMPAKMSKSDFF